MRLAEIRRAKGLAQYRLAGLAGVPVSELYRIERRGMAPTRAQAQRLAEALGVATDDVDELAEGTSDGMAELRRHTRA